MERSPTKRMPLFCRFFAGLLCLTLGLPSPVFALRLSQPEALARKAEIQSGLEEITDQDQLQQREWVRQVQKEEGETAMQRLMRRHRGLIHQMAQWGFSLAHYRGGFLSMDEALEIAGEGFQLGIWKFDLNRRPPVKVVTFLYTAMRNHMRDRVKKMNPAASRRVSVFQESQMTSNPEWEQNGSLLEAHGGLSLNDGLHHLMDEEILARWTAGLTPEEREIVAGMIKGGGDEGRTLRQMAKALGKSSQQVAQSLDSALVKIRRAVAGEIEGGKLTVEEVGEGSLREFLLKGLDLESQVARQGLGAVKPKMDLKWPLLGQGRLRPLVTEYLLQLRDSPSEKDQIDYRTFLERLSATQRGDLLASLEHPEFSLKQIGEQRGITKEGVRVNLISAFGWAILLANARRDGPGTLSAQLWEEGGQFGTKFRLFAALRQLKKRKEGFLQHRASAGSAAESPTGGLEEGLDFATPIGTLEEMRHAVTGKIYRLANIPPAAELQERRFTNSRGASVGLEEKIGYVAVEGVGLLVPPDFPEESYFAVAVGTEQAAALVAAGRAPSRLIVVATGLEDAAGFSALGVPADQIVPAGEWPSLEAAKNYAIRLGQEWLKGLQGLRVSVLEVTARTLQGAWAQLQEMLPSVWQMARPVTPEEAQNVLEHSV